MLNENINAVNLKQQLKYVVKAEDGALAPSSESTEIPRPKWGDWLSGLGIAVNDTWGYNVTIENLKIYKHPQTGKKMFQANFDIEIFDHFGLDNNDIDPNIKFVYSRLPVFNIWFVLQHFTRYGKKPFITVVRFKKTIVDEI